MRSGDSGAGIRERTTTILHRGLDDVKFLADVQGDSS
jgi:hypothetical protein